MKLRNSIWDNQDLISLLQKGGVAVMPTDTIYGLVARSQDEFAVRRLYEIRKRSPDKPCIVLIGDMAALSDFSVELREAERKKVKEYWSDLYPTSIILDCPDPALAYLHRGTHTLAFRLPISEGLRSLLLKTGPLIAPSANLEAFPASESITDAEKYFGEQVDLYVDGGIIRAKASRLVRLHKDGSVSILRE